MSKDMHHLHSHSGIEKKLLFPKNMVLVDCEYAGMFEKEQVKKLVYNGVEYCKVPILAFVYKGGIFKNFSK